MLLGVAAFAWNHWPDVVEYAIVGMARSAANNPDFKSGPCSRGAGSTGGAAYPPVEEPATRAKQAMIHGGGALLWIGGLACIDN